MIISAEIQFAGAEFFLAQGAATQLDDEAVEENALGLHVGFKLAAGSAIERFEDDGIFVFAAEEVRDRPKTALVFGPTTFACDLHLTMCPLSHAFWTVYAAIHPLYYTICLLFEAILPAYAAI